MTKAEDLVKLQVNMTKSAIDQLDKLKDEIDASSRTETVKASLKFFNYVQNQKKDGARFIVRDKDGNEREIVF